jgi:hypothetical protein
MRPSSLRLGRLALVAGLALAGPASAEAAPPRVRAARARAATKPPKDTAKQNPPPSGGTAVEKKILPAMKPPAPPPTAVEKKILPSMRPHAGGQPPPATSPVIGGVNWAAELTKTALANGIVRDTTSGIGKYEGVAVSTARLGERVALSDFSLRFRSPRRGRMRGIGVEPILPGVRYDFSSANADFVYAASSYWHKLSEQVQMRHVTAVCSGSSSLCRVDADLEGKVPVLGGFAFRFSEAWEIEAITIMPDHPGYVVHVKSPSRGQYTVDLWLALIDPSVVLDKGMEAGDRTGTSAAAKVPKLAHRAHSQELLQGFSVRMTDGPHPVGELSISGANDGHPTANVIFQDDTRTRPMTARLFWVRVR